MTMKRVGDTLDGGVVQHVLEHADDEDGSYIVLIQGKQYLVQLNEGGHNGTRIALDALEAWSREHRPPAEPAGAVEIKTYIHNPACITPSSLCAAQGCIIRGDSGLPEFTPPEPAGAAGEVERVHTAIMEWADRMRERGVEKLYDTAARYHLGLTIKGLLAQERSRTTFAETAEQLRVQLAGCGVAALGGIGNRCQVASRGDYGWSQSYQDVLELRQKYEALLSKEEPKETTAPDWKNREQLRGYLSTLTPWRHLHPEEVPDEDVHAIAHLLEISR